MDLARSVLPDAPYNGLQGHGSETRDLTAGELTERVDRDRERSGERTYCRLSVMQG